MMAEPTPHQCRAYELVSRLTHLADGHTQAVAAAVGRRLCWEGIPVKICSRTQTPTANDHPLDIRLTEALEVDGAMVDEFGIHADWDALSRAHGIPVSAWDPKSVRSFDPQNARWLSERDRPLLVATIRLLASMLAPEDRARLRRSPLTPAQARAQQLFDMLADRPDIAPHHHSIVVGRQLSAEGIPSRIESRLLRDQGTSTQMYVSVLALDGALLDGTAVCADWEEQRHESVRAWATSLVHTHSDWSDVRSQFDPCDDRAVGNQILPEVVEGLALLAARLQEQALEDRTCPIRQTHRVSLRL